MKTSHAPQLIIGLGTGRCGTVSLSTLLSGQPSTCVIHEGDSNGERHIFPWDGDSVAVIAWLHELSQRCSQFERFGDVGFYFLPYVESILKKWPSARFIVMRRDREATVRSYERKTEGRNHWIDHDGIQWRHDPRWDPTYPTYPVPSKREALERYWDDYYRQAAELVNRHPGAVRIFDVSTLNSDDGQRELLTFAGVPPAIVRIGGAYRENTGGSRPTPPDSAAVERRHISAASWLSRFKGMLHTALRRSRL